MPAFLMPILAMIAQMGGWELASWATRGVGKKLLGDVAAKAATGAGAKLAASSVGKALEKGLEKTGTGWVRNQLPASASAIPSSVISGVAGMGTMVAGMKGAELAGEMFTPKQPKYEYPENAFAVSEQMNQATMRAALKSYTGANDSALDNFFGRVV